MNYDDYKNKMDYPNRPLSPPRLSAKATPEDYRRHANLLEIYNIEKEKYKEKMAEFQKEDWRLREKFKHDALEDTGLLGHPKAEKVWKFVTDHFGGHGLPDICFYLGEVADLVL